MSAASILILCFDFVALISQANPRPIDEWCDDLMGVRSFGRVGCWWPLDATIVKVYIFAFQDVPISQVCSYGKSIPEKLFSSNAIALS